MAKVAVVGLGNMAKHWHLPSLQRVPEAEIVAVCDLDRTKAKHVAEEFNTEPFYDFDAVLKDRNPDAVYVVTPSDTHFDIVRKSIEAGCHVFCEKPLTPTLGEVEALCDLSVKHDRVLMVGYNRGLAPVYERMRAVAAEHRPVLFVLEKTRYLDAGARQLFTARPSLCSDHGLLREFAGHMYDLAQTMCGTIARSSTSTARQFDGMDCGVAFTSILKHENGAVSSVSYTLESGQACERSVLYCEGATCEVVGGMFEVNAAIVTTGDGRQEFPGPDDALERAGFLPENRRFIQRAMSGEVDCESLARYVETARLISSIGQ